MESIGLPLTRFFKDRGITQDEIAKKLGVSQSYVSALITGKKNFGKRQAERFSKLYGLSPSWLLTGEGEMLVSTSGNTQVIGSNHGTAINGGSLESNKCPDKQFRDYVLRKDAQVAELIAQNGKLIDIIETLSKNKLP